MSSIEPKYFLLYDLETSRTEFLGQIMTAFFQLVDTSFQPIEEKSLDLQIRVSRLELPEPEALLTNRIRLSEHQLAGISEREAALKMKSFIQQCIDFAGPWNIRLTGYNSSKFDLPFVRTTLIRNGINPYFKGQILYGDAIHWMKKLAWEHQDFPLERIQGETGEYYSFKLERLTKSFGLLEGEQTHSAEDDVELLRQLLELVQERFHCSFWDESNVEFPSALFHAKFPNYQLEENEARYQSKPVYLLDRSKSAALLVDLEAFKETGDKDSVRYVNQGTGFLAVDSDCEVNDDLTELSKRAQKTFNGLNLGNFFEVSDCDIEQDIYRLPFPEIKELGNMIQSDQGSSRGSQDLRQLWRRYNLRESEFPAEGSSLRKHFEAALTGYFQSRYIKGVKLNKFGEDRYTRPLDEWVDHLESLTANAMGEDLLILQDLKEYFLQSDMKKCL